MKSFMNPLKVTQDPQSSIVYTLKSTVLDKQKPRKFTTNILSLKSEENKASRNKYQHQMISEGEFEMQEGMIKKIKW